MFSGIIAAIGNIQAITDNKTDKTVVINTGALDLVDLQLGDSIAVNGVCLSIVKLQPTKISVDLSAETLSCTTLKHLIVGDSVNLEKPLRLSSRLNGHLVSGHVDATGSIHKRHTDERSECLEINFPVGLEPYICKKGSICVDGVSLTINHVNGTRFSTNIIPHTQMNTIFNQYTIGREVNLEIDMIARYIESIIKQREQDI